MDFRRVQLIINVIFFYYFCYSIDVAQKMLFSVKSKNEGKIIFMQFPVDYFKENCIFQTIIASKGCFFFSNKILRYTSAL